ncbi:anaerobic ribonucleoside triphosphate reductase [Planctomycetes bacterium Pan216]|uniref:Anaerobic ribonucleoside triphosphate reductase n=1 Tax=Kolteria novifilia TaxID=2527975 RepID=A0A518B2C3_9BACT|nr:anaerobic ribonucleoside triphosphate reductase [Planctomycetes bacterium Pan216]
MNLLPEDLPAELWPEAVQFVRKRDGSVEPFDPAKLVGSLYAARQEVEPESAAFDAQEFAQAALHFLIEEFEGRTPSTSDIGETVTKVLRELGQGPTAQLYADYRDRRQSRRDSMKIVEQEGAAEHSAKSSGTAPEEASAWSTSGRTRVQSWDKGRLARALETDADLDPVTAREIAATTERYLLAGDFHRIPSGLVRELVDYELRERGLHHVLQRRGLLGIPTNILRERLASKEDPDAVMRWAGREILNQYSLKEVFSPDIAGLHQEGLIYLFDAATPGQWAAGSVDVVALAQRTSGSRAFLDELERSLDEVARKIVGTIALDGVDATLALWSDLGDDPVELADRFASILSGILRGRESRFIVNLYARVTPWAADLLSGGPLFSTEPSREQHAFASKFALRLAERVLEGAQLQRRCRLDLHPPMEGDEEELKETLRPWWRWLVRDTPLALSFDRGETSLGEGLRRVRGRRPAVYQYVGIMLPRLYRRLGEGSDAATIIERLGLLCESSVRAGVQRREFLRHSASFSEMRPSASALSLVVVPFGLDWLVYKLIGRSISSDAGALSLAEQIVSRLQHRLRREGRPYQLATIVDGHPAALDEMEMPSVEGESNQLWGVTPSLAGPGPRQQILAGARLHSGVGGGTTYCRLPPSSEIDFEEILDLAVMAARRTETSRLKFVFPSPAKQSTLGDDWLP